MKAAINRNQLPQGAHFVYCQKGKINTLIRWALALMLMADIMMHEVISTQTLAKEDYFPNSGFEMFPIGGTNDWTWPSSNWDWDGNVAHSGARSARVSGTLGSETTSLQSAYISVLPSREYTLTYWLRMENVTLYPRVWIRQYRSDGSQTGPRVVAYANIGDGTNDWNIVNYRFQTMPDAIHLRLRLFLYSDTSGTFWFDDFDLSEGRLARFPFKSGFPIDASGWVGYSSPTVADINQDGNNEVLVGAGNSLNGWDSTGAKLPGFPISTGDRSISSQIALDDLDHDGQMEIVAGTRTTNPEGQCRVFAWRSNGTLLNGWPQWVAWNTQYSHNDCWVPSIVLADIDGDHDLEILAGSTNNAAGNPGGNNTVANLYAWHPNGSLVNGNWPFQQVSAAVYGNMAAGDLNGDVIDDILVGRDYHRLDAYSGAGISLPGWPVTTYLNSNSGNYQTDFRMEYALSAPILADIDSDGITEYIVVGHVAGPANSVVILNSAMLVMRPDGTRLPGWEIPAQGMGVLTQADLPRQAPVVADINDDGYLEIISATEDGWIRAYRPNKTILWAVNYTQGGILFASEPVIGDIDGDGNVEIVFGTFVAAQNATDYDGPVGLWALENDGTTVAGFPLVIPTPGVRAAPSLADLDGDGKLDILAATRTGQVIVWDTGTPYNPSKIPWPTGRHDLRRTATYTPLTTLEASHISVVPHYAELGETATVTIGIISNKPIYDTISMTNTLPAGVSYVPDTLAAGSGTAIETAGVIHWSGNLANALTVEISYDVIVTTASAQTIHNTAFINSGADGILLRNVDLFVNYESFFLPIITR